MGNLKFTITRKFKSPVQWNDQGSGGDMDGAFWRPDAPEGYSILGDHAQNNYDAPNGIMVVVKDDGSGGKPAIVEPTDFHRIWGDWGSGANLDGSFWLPIPPSAEYVAMGVIVNRGYDKPKTNVVVCVRADLIVPAVIGSLIYNDMGSGADHDLSTYAINTNPQFPDSLVAGTFFAEPNYNRPNGAVYALANA